MMRTAVIVETRELPDLVRVIDSHMKMLPGFKLIVFGSTLNEGIIKKNFPEARFIDLGVTTFSEMDYNRLLASRFFWDQCLGKVLIFQHDSRILREGVEEFIEWDYVGAPWQFQEHGGNGGLSLRSQTMMKKVINTVEYNPSRHGNEDVYFSNYIPHLGGKLAPREVCERFSCESIFKLGTLGVHAIEKYLTAEQVSQILTQYEPTRSEV